MQNLTHICIHINDLNKTILLNTVAAVIQYIKYLKCTIHINNRNGYTFYFNFACYSSTCGLNGTNIDQNNNYNKKNHN